MKIRVTIDAQSYEVEVGDLNARPIQATVEGDTFLVWPDEAANDSLMANNQPAANSLPTATAPAVKRAPATAPVAQPAAPANGSGAQPSGAQAVNSAKAVLAPIPGVIIAMNVKEGQAVTFGQELCVLEAMKMKNVIRASRAGTVAAIRVAIGDQVKRSQVLIEYTD